MGRGDRRVAVVYFREVMPIFLSLVSHPSFDMQTFLQRHTMPGMQIVNRLTEYLNAEAELRRIHRDNVAATWLLWLIGSALTIGRIAHAWGLIKTYGPSPGRAIGFFLTWFVYLVGAGACVYFGVVGVFQ
jgi:uncharacterized membrane protein YecN with MAPEG domain